MSVEQNSEQQTSGSQYILFELAGEPYGAGIDAVHEVLPFKGVTRIPGAGGSIEGVISLRGYAIPVIDLARKFGLGAVSPGKHARIVIIETGGQVAGLAVDRVSDVTTISGDDIEPPTAMIRGALKADYLIGFAESAGTLVKILDLESVFSEEELAGFQSLEEDEAKNSAGPEE